MGKYYHVVIIHAVLNVTQDSVEIVQGRECGIVLAAKQVNHSSVFHFSFCMLQAMCCLVQKIFLYVETLVVRCAQ